MSRSLLTKCTCFLRPPTPSRQLSSTSTLLDNYNQESYPSSSAPSTNRSTYTTPRQRSFGIKPPEGPVRNDSQWRSTSKPIPRIIPLNPRIGEAQRLYKLLAPEGKRREDLARQKMLESFSVEKLYAIERERQRIYSSSLDHKPVEDKSKLINSVHAILRVPTPQREERDKFNNASRVIPAARVIGSRLPKDSRGNRIDPAPRKEGGANIRDIKQTMEKVFRKDGVYMTAGKINRGTSTRSLPMKGIQPILRGQYGSSGPKKKAPRVLKKVVLPSTIRLENLTNLLGVKLRFLQRAMERIGLENSRPERLLTAEDASLVALELNFDPIVDDEAAFDIYPSPPPLETDILPLRPPVTGIFGHVDHGKTSLLDRLRSTTVAAGEAGGITQHIGAFEVSISSITKNLRAQKDSQGSKGRGSTVLVEKKSERIEEEEEDAGTITFLDTPGHAAFTAMRERGAGVTDVVVLVVAADDGVKPQTEEVIGLIKSSDVGVVVAITKCDKPGVDVTKVKQSLMAAGVEIEAFGGDVPCVEVSSVTGQGLPELLETIAAIAEVRELKAERIGRVEGRVLESRVEKGRGNVATVLVLRGCLRVTSTLVAGTTWCRVRSLLPPSGDSITSAYPGQPVEVTGWKDLPSAGDQVLESLTEDDAKKAVANRIKRVEQSKSWADIEIINEKRRIDSESESVRKEEERKAKASGLKGNAITYAGLAAVDQLTAAGGKNTEIKELVIIIKADVSGTVEAVVGALEGIGNSEAKVKIIFSGVGDVTDADVDMAKAVGGSVVGFNVKAPNSILKSAALAPVVPIHTSPIIYRLVDTIRLAVADLLPKTIETRVHSEALVQQLFEITVKGRKEKLKIAGSKVNNGVFQKGRKARVMRRGEIIHTGTVSTLKQLKKDVTEISKGVECGIALDDFDSFETDDIIQSIEEVEIARVL